MDLDAAAPVDYQISMQDPAANRGIRRRLSLVETFQSYVQGQARLGIIHLLNGFVILALAGTLMWFTLNSIWAALVLLFGTIFAITGLTVIDQRQKHLRSAATMPCLFNFLSVILSVTLLGFNCYGMYRIEINVTEVYPDYRRPHTELMPLEIIHSFLLAGSLVEICASIVCLYKLIGAECCPPQRKRIYTVPFDELEESVASSPDILRDVRQQPMLQINWMERNSVRT